MITNGFRRLCFLLLLSSIAACDEPTRLSRGLGLYRLVSVAGSPVPAEVSVGSGLVTFFGGDLQLEESNGFVYVVQGLPRAIDRGSWDVDGSDLVLSSLLTGEITPGIMQGDSVVLRISVTSSSLSQQRLDFTFRLDGSPALMTGTYVLSRLMGNPDRRYEFAHLGQTPIQFFEVTYDTITFVDELIFRRSRSQLSGQVGVDGGARISVGGFGSYRRSGEVLELRLPSDFYSPDLPPTDSLMVGESIVRKRLRFDIGEPVELVEIYERAD